jgi:anti-sigma factor RsiW
MGGAVNHEDLQELLAAFALDAVEADEAEIVEAHLSTCPRCRAELAGYREVTSLFAYSGQEAPAGIWDRITTSMQEVPPPLRMDRIRESMLGQPGAADEPARLGRRRVDAARPASERRRRRWIQVGARPALAVAAAVIVCVAVLGVQLVRLHDRVSSLEGQARAAATTPAVAATMVDVRRALAAPGARKVVLASPDGVLSEGQATLDAVILPDGTGYLYDSKLTPLPDDRVYQLWGVVGAKQQRISYGLLGTDPQIETFQAGTGLQALAVTNEVASGVVATTQPFTVVGDVTPAL